MYTLEQRQKIGITLLTLADTEPTRAYWVLKSLGLCIADLQQAGFTEMDIQPLKKGWRQVQQRMARHHGGAPPRIYDG